MAALAGLADIGPYQWWELRILAEERQAAEWEKVAWLSMHAIAPYAKGDVKAEDFNPLKLAVKAQEDMSFHELAAQYSSDGTLSNDEIEERWKEIQEQCQQQAES